MYKDDLDKIYQRYPIYKQIIELVNMFRQMVRERNVNELSTWIDTAKSFENTYINSFIGGITRDMSAVKNAIAFDYNNGLAEGSVNKLKVMKRIMYGRNSFELLRKKMLRSEKRRKIN
jgi:transposase